MQKHVWKNHFNVNLDNYFHPPLSTFNTTARVPFLCLYDSSAIIEKQVHNSVYVSTFEAVLLQEFIGYVFSFAHYLEMMTVNKLLWRHFKVSEP